MVGNSSHWQSLLFAAAVFASACSSQQEAAEDSGTKDSGSSEGDGGGGESDGGGEVSDITHGRELNSTNTGVQAGIELVQSASIVVTEDWIANENGGSRTIEKRLFPSGTGIDMRVNDVTIRNCRFLGAGGSSKGQAITAEVENTTIEWSEFDGEHENLRDHVAIGGDSLRLYRVHMHRWPRGLWISGPVVVEETYMHALTGDDSGAHIENIYVAGGAGQRYIKNRLDSDCAGPGGCAISASLAIYNEDWAVFPPLADIVIKDNYFNSDGGAVLYAGALSGKGAAYPTQMIVSGNEFGRELNRRSGFYVPAFAFDASQPGNTWSDNTWGERGSFWQDGDPEAGAPVEDPGIM